MSRPRTKLDDNQRQAQRVDSALSERARSAEDRRRLTAVKLGFEPSHSLDYIAEVTGASVATIKRWFAAYRAGGVDALLANRRGKGFASRFTPEHAAALRAALPVKNFRRAADVRAWLKKEHNLEAPLSSVYRYLGKARRG